MLLKCCTQYVSNSGKLSSGHRTGKGQFSLQSQRRAMPKNVQTTAQLHSSHTLAKMLKILQARLQQCMNCELLDVQAGFIKNRGTRDQIANIRWIIKKAKEFQKNSISASLTALKPLAVWITTNWKILKDMWTPDHLTCLLRNLYAGEEVTVRTGYGTMSWFKIGQGVCQGCIFLPCLLNLYAE